MYENSIITHFFLFFFFSLFFLLFFSFVVFFSFSFSNQQKYIHVCTIVVNMPHSTVDMPFTYCFFFFFLAPKNCITIITYYKVVTQIGVCTYKAMRHVSLW